MNQIKWSDGLSVGVKAIDDDHKHLISIINRLFVALDTNASKNMLASVFDELEKYTVYHFDHEEQLMYAQCSSFEDEAYIDAHVKQHKGFFNSIPELKKKLLNASSKELSLEVVEFLANWLLEHIVKEDLSFTEYLMKNKKIEEIRKEDSFFNRLISRLNNTVTLPTRAFLILLIPFITLFLLSSLLSYDLYTKYTQRNEVAQASKSFICINKITDNLQKERGLSSGFMASKHQEFSKELQHQRELSTQSIKQCGPMLTRLYRYEDRDTNVLLDILSQESLKLEGVRESINSSTMNKRLMMRYYTSLIATLLDLVERTGSLTKGYIPLQSSLLIMLHLKENSGLLRAEGASILAENSMNHQKFKALIASSSAYKEAFNALSTQELSKQMQSIDNKENSQVIQALQDEIISGSQKVKPAVWFNKISLKIEAYNELISHIALQIDTSASAQRDKSLLYMTVLWISLFIVLLLAFVISFALKQSIVRPIESFTLAMKRLANGDKTYFNYTYQADDAIKEMIAAFENFRRSLIKSELSDILLEIKGKKADDFERLSQIDPLTNTLNRRKFRDLYEQEFIIAQDTNSSLSLLALDLDKFKIINDTYGHEAGDKVLIAFSNEVMKMIRPTDYFARVGGEEFLVLLPMTDKERAVEIAQRICKKLEDLDLCRLHKELKVTVSIGVGVYLNGSTMESIIKQADENLYRSKSEGRNRVSF